MFSNKKNVNILTSELIEFGIQNIVVCPGSRNAPIVHNLNQHPYFQLYPITDERSAAFAAIGISIATQKPTAVCVTSGSALLNTLPAVAEAYYRYCPLLIISADRPEERIGQLDGQTLIQNRALEPYATTLQLCEPQNQQEEEESIRKIGEGLSSLFKNAKQPFHINVPISEPLFQFTTPLLPKVSVSSTIKKGESEEFSTEDINNIKRAKLPVLFIGHFDTPPLPYDTFEKNHQLLVLPEIVGNTNLAWRTTIIEELGDRLGIQPDVVIHIGGNIVNKKLKQILQQSKDCKVFRIEPGKDSPNTFFHLEKIIRGETLSVLDKLEKSLPSNKNIAVFQERLKCIHESLNNLLDYNPSHFSDLGVMQKIAQKIFSIKKDYVIHLANSSVVRNATYFFGSNYQNIYCNRGVNGIEGSLSTAVGHSLVYNGIVFVFIGDLSFFYDNNALWNNSLKGNLRIFLFNNGGGQIFNRLEGLKESQAYNFISADHSFTAKGIAEAFNIDYYAAHDYTEIESYLCTMTEESSNRPKILEIFTLQNNNHADLIKMHEYYQLTYKQKSYEKKLDHH